MRILNVCFDDHANLMYNITEAMQAAGAFVRCCKIQRHSFGYRHQAPVVTYGELLKACQGADLVQVFHSWSEPLLFSDKAKKVVWHTGTTYRQQPEQCNAFFNPRTELTITDQTEFLKLGAKNIHYITSPITISAPSLKQPIKPYVIGHYPSNPMVKGTSEILRIVTEFIKEHPGSFVLDCSTDKLSHEEHLRRVAGCDLYIELFAPVQQGKEYGCFGISALEAAAMGKVVLTQNVNEQVYTDTYGSSNPFIWINSEAVFIDTLQHLSQADELQLHRLQKLARLFCQKNHSMQATGMRILRLLEKYC